MTGDSVALALEHALRIKEAAESVGAGGRGFRRRARDLPSLALSAGLVPALTFYLSKVERGDLLSEALELLRGSRKPEEAAKKLGGELGDKEGAGYTIMLAAIAVAAEALAGVSLLAGGGDPRISLAQGLRKLRERAGEERRLLRILQPYLTELKKLADAFFG